MKNDLNTSSKWLERIEKSRKMFPVNNIEEGNYKYTRWERNERLVRRATESPEKQTEKVDAGFASIVLERYLGTMGEPDFNLRLDKGYMIEQSNINRIIDDKKVRDKIDTVEELIRQSMKDTGYQGVMNEANEDTVIYGDSKICIRYNSEGKPFMHVVDIDKFVWDTNYYRLESPDGFRKSMWAGYLTQMSKAEFDQYADSLNETGKWKIKDYKELYGKIDVACRFEDLQERREKMQSEEWEEKDEKDFVQFYYLEDLRCEDGKPRVYLLVGRQSRLYEYKGDYPYKDLKGNPSLSFGELESTGRARGRYTGSPVDKVADVQYAYNTAMNIILNRAKQETFIAYMCRNKDIEYQLNKAFKNARNGIARILSADVDDTDPIYKDKPISFFFEPVQLPPLSIDIKEVAQILKDMASTKTGIYLSVFSDQSAKFATDVAEKSMTSEASVKAIVSVNEKTLNYQRIIEQFISRYKYYLEQLETDTVELEGYKEVTVTPVDERSDILEKDMEGRKLSATFLEKEAGETAEISKQDVLEILENISVSIKSGSAIVNSKSSDYQRKMVAYQQMAGLNPIFADKAQKLIMRDLVKDAQVGISSEDVEDIYLEIEEEKRKLEEEKRKIEEEKQAQAEQEQLTQQNAQQAKEIPQAGQEQAQLFQ